MKTTFFYKNLTKAEEKSFKEYLESKLPSIENLLEKFSEDKLILKASIEKFDKHDAYGVELSLTIRNKNIIASEASHHITKAVDDCKDRFLTQLKKHQNQKRDTRSHRSIRKQHVVVTEDVTA